MQNILTVMQERAIEATFKVASGYAQGSGK